MKENPEKRPKVAVRPDPENGPSAPVRGCLLLVEDHDPTRHALQRLLTALDFDVRAAASIAEAWALVEHTRFDVLVSDIGLPDGDGFMLMHQLKDRYGMKGIALTGFDWEDDFRLSREAGFSAHLVKPVQAIVLDRVLASLGM
jgi:CheY-like chemotaxis protein